MRKKGNESSIRLHLRFKLHLVHGLAFQILNHGLLAFLGEVLALENLKLPIEIPVDLRYPHHVIVGHVIHVGEHEALQVPQLVRTYEVHEPVDVDPLIVVQIEAPQPLRPSQDEQNRLDDGGVPNVVLASEASEGELGEISERLQKGSF